MKPVYGLRGEAAKRFDDWWYDQALAGCSFREVASLGFDAGHAFWHEQQTPIDMVLHCPQCMTQHIDRPVGQFYPGMTADESAAQNKAYGHWDNPPHRSHLCAECGHIWRPADVPTNGVVAIKTRGRNDS